MASTQTVTEPRTRTHSMNSPTTVTRECCKQKGKVGRREVTIVDTPGLFDTSLSDDSVKREISKCINMSAPGPHAILLVIKVGVFTAKERDAVKKVEEMFGEDAWKYTIILFTHGDEVKSEFEQELVKKARAELLEILKKVGNRYHVFSNVKINDRGQVLNLLEKVEKMVFVNGAQCYSNPTYLKVVQMLHQREKELREFYQKKLEEEVKAVRSQYEQELSKRQEVEERLQSELEEVKRYYQALERGVRYVVEQTVPSDSFDDVLNKFHETLTLKLN